MNRARTKFYLVRHGEPDWDLAFNYDLQGPLSDFVPLTDTGIKQSEAAALDARLRCGELIVSSPYTRALHTAAILCRELRLPLQVHYDLRERVPCLKPEFLSVKEVIECCRDYELHSGEYPPGETRLWETKTSIRKRVLKALSFYASSYSCVIAVCHEKVIESILPVERIPYCGIYEYELIP